MNFKYFSLRQNLIKVLFILLIIVYYIIGIYLIQQTSITSDESAYIGAAYAYTKGLGLNQEHPLFFKLINSAIINSFFPDYQVAVPSIKIITGEESIEARLAAFNLGYNLLMEQPETFKRLLFSLRLPYLIFNSFLLFWLYLYTFVFQKINSQISLVFAILFVFSPSFYSHNFLIAFDVAVSVYGLLSILTLRVIADQIGKESYQNLVSHFVILTLLLFVALNAKFSNLILLPIIAAAYFIIALHLFKNSQKKRLILFASLASVSLLIQPLLISLMYSWAFRNLPNQSLFNNFIAYLQGIQMNLSTAGGIREPFWQGKFTAMTSGDYLIKVLWFKENPGLFIITGILLIILIGQIFQEKRLKIAINQKTLPLILLSAAYPLIYFFLTKNSRFIIGYRYFYPIILFLYLGIASLTLIVQHKWQKYVLLGGMTIYVYLGIVGIPQSLSYVNPLWTQDKWQLTDDSTINWGQETQHAVEYLLTHQLLPEENNHVITYQLFGVNIGFVQYLDLISKQQDYPIDIESYYAQSRFNYAAEEIAKLPHQYLLIDSTVKQQISAHKNDNKIVAKNWEFFKKHQPLYSRNDIIFIYQLH